MVNVAHDHHHGSTGLQIFGTVLGGVDQLLLDGDDHFVLHLAAHFLGDDGGGVEVDDLAHGGHHAVLHQALDHFRAGFLHAAGQLAHADLIGDLHLEGSLLGNFQLQAAHLLLLGLAALVGEGHIVVAAVIVAAEFFLALGHFTGALTGLGAFRHVLQALVVFIQIHVGGLAGVHDLGLGHAGGHGRRSAGGSCAALGALLLCGGCGLGVALGSGVGFRRSLAVLFGLGLCVFFRKGIGENDLDAGNLILAESDNPERWKFPPLSSRRCGS